MQNKKCKIYFDGRFEAEYFESTRPQKRVDFIFFEETIIVFSGNKVKTTDILDGALTKIEAKITELKSIRSKIKRNQLQKKDKTR